MGTGGLTGAKGCKSLAKRKNLVCHGRCIFQSFRVISTN